MRNLAMIAILIGIISVTATAKVSLNVYESDGLTLYDGRNIMVGTESKLIIASDANDFWSGGLFIGGNNRNLAILSGNGKDPNSKDYSGSHWEDAGLEAWVTRWEDSLIEGFGLFSDSNCVPARRVCFQLGCTRAQSGSLRSRAVVGVS